MRLSLALLFILLVSCTEHTCVEFGKMNWCLENAEYSIVNSSELFFNNTRDGLNFEARIKTDCNTTSIDISEFDQSFISSKDGIPFKVYYSELHPELKLASVKFLKGVAISKKVDINICIEWVAVNERKALRLIKQLVSNETP